MNTKSCLRLAFRSAGLALAAPLLFALGCASDGGRQPAQPSAAINPDQPFVFPGQTSADSNPGIASGDAAVPVSNPYPPDTSAAQLATSAATLRVGEKIMVTYSDIPQPPMPHEQRIRDDGTITLPLIGPVVALGKSPGQLEDAIHKAYVPDYYRRITVVVDADERTFSVGGEVKISNRQHYTDRITVLRAIQAAGDFTDFADRRRIELIRSFGRKEIVDWYEAKDHPEFDLEVFPGDQIIVRKRAF